MIVEFYTFLWAFQLEDARMATEFELEMLSMNPDPEPILMELIHKVKFLFIR